MGRRSNDNFRFCDSEFIEAVMRIVVPDSLRALRSRNYRLFFMAQAISLTGLWMHRVAMGWLVFRLTGLNSALGIIDFAASISVFIFAPFAGALIERWDLRKTLFCCQAGCMMVAFILAFLTLTGLVTLLYSGLKPSFKVTV